MSIDAVERERKTFLKYLFSAVTAILPEDQWQHGMQLGPSREELEAAAGRGGCVCVRACVCLRERVCVCVCVRVCV